MRASKFGGVPERGKPYITINTTHSLLVDSLSVTIIIYESYMSLQCNFKKVPTSGFSCPEVNRCAVEKLCFAGT